MASTFIQLPINESIISGPISVTIDKLKIWDGVDILSINSDGSINTKDLSLNNHFVEYAEITSIASSTLSTVLTFPPASPGLIQLAHFSGNQIAEWTIVKNSTIVFKHYTSFSEGLGSNVELNLPIANGDTIEVKVVHNRPGLGDFNATLSCINL